MARTPSFVLGAVALLTVAATVAGAGDAPADRDVERGAELYRIYCATCHGEHGRGDGPTAEMLKVAPADLTRLRRRGEGTFPADRVRRVIDGRDAIRGHGDRTMPIWGIAFQELNSDRNQEAEVRLRIDRLVAFLQSVQAAESPPPR